MKLSSPSQNLIVHSPRCFQVFQRESAGEGSVLVSGRCFAACDRIELALQGGETEERASLAPDPVTGAFFNWMPALAGGWYTIEVKALKAGATVAEASVEHIGVGEVFVMAGQSNSTNSGGEGQLKVVSGLVSTFDGASWRLADDPQPGAHDCSDGGSCWPAFGDELVKRLKVPVGMAVTGHGGTSVNEWATDTELFQWFMTRVWQLGPGGFRGVLWHQGESDVEMASEEYVTKLTDIVATSKRLAGWEFPWIVAKASYHSPEKPAHESMRAAHQRLWDQGVAIEGPDTDTLEGDNRDEGGLGIHFSPKGLGNHGRMWADCVASYLRRLSDG